MKHILIIEQELTNHIIDGNQDLTDVPITMVEFHLKIRDKYLKRAHQYTMVERYDKRGHREVYTIGDVDGKYEE